MEHCLCQQRYLLNKDNYIAIKNKKNLIQPNENIRKV